MHPTPDPASAGPQSTDSPGWRVVFAILQGQRREWLRAVVFLVIVLGALVALAVVAGPWVPSALTALGTLTAGGAAIARAHTGRRVEKPPDPAVEPLESDSAVTMGPTLAA